MKHFTSSFVLGVPPYKTRKTQKHKKKQKQKRQKLCRFLFLWIALCSYDNNNNKPMQNTFNCVHPSKRYYLLRVRVPDMIHKLSTALYYYTKIELAYEIANKKGPNNKKRSEHQELVWSCLAREAKNHPQSNIITLTQEERPAQTR
jgi:hypothetical protein